jgi:hypothetical protein
MIIANNQLTSYNTAVLAAIEDAADEIVAENKPKNQYIKVFNQKFSSHMEHFPEHELPPDNGASKGCFPCCYSKNSFESEVVKKIQAKVKCLQSESKATEINVSFLPSRFEERKRPNATYSTVTVRPVPAKRQLETIEAIANEKSILYRVDSSPRQGALEKQSRMGNSSSSSSSPPPERGTLAKLEDQHTTKLGEAEKLAFYAAREKNSPLPSEE